MTRRLLQWADKVFKVKGKILFPKTVLLYAKDKHLHRKGSTMQTPCTCVMYKNLVDTLSKTVIPCIVEGRLRRGRQIKEINGTHERVDHSMQDLTPCMTDTGGAPWPLIPHVWFPQRPVLAGQLYHRSTDLLIRYY